LHVKNFTLQILLLFLSTALFSQFLCVAKEQGFVDELAKHTRSVRKIPEYIA